MEETNYNKKVGIWGEALARDFLIKRGYKLIEQNVKTSYQEIDLIFWDKNNIFVVVEVKTRISQSLGGAEDMMSRKKIVNLHKAAYNYIGSKKLRPKSIRIDFVAINFDKKTKLTKIKHYSDIG